MRQFLTAMIAALILLTACGSSPAWDDSGVNEDDAGPYDERMREILAEEWKAEQQSTLGEIAYDAYLENEDRNRLAEAAEGLAFLDELAAENGKTREQYLADLTLAEEKTNSTSTQPYVREGANLRSGPGTNFDKVGGASTGTPLNIDGISSDGEWFHLTTDMWIFGELVKNAPTGLPVVPSTSEQSCVIKGNVGYGTGEKIYHLPNCPDYDKTVIDERYGERWFCTEDGARENGWRKAWNCP